MALWGRNRRNIPQKSNDFHGFLGMQIDAERKGGGGQGWIRTSVRLRGQIYSLLPLTTRPPVHMIGLQEAMQETVPFRGQPDAERRPFGEAALACQWSGWQCVRLWQNRNEKEHCADALGE